ncbi:aldo/keto reductase [Collibacillus ludicampi]|uniref:aldo/keto reductase n=1 Tax=Collibacillus ludicampi TaxID=2771369 RepID=UPI0034E300F3
MGSLSIYFVSGTVGSLPQIKYSSYKKYEGECILHICIYKVKNESTAQVALNWVRQHPVVHIPIIGARTLFQLQDNLR